MTGLNGFDNSGGANQFGVSLGIEERAGGVIALTLDGGEFKEAECLITPEQAKDLGEVLVRYGLHALTGMETEKGMVIKEIVRKKLAVRVQHMARNLTERQYGPEYIAQEAVDIVLRELL